MFSRAMDPYPSLAELSLALIGFSALIGVFGSRTEAESALETLTLRMLVEIALISFALSLLPIVIAPMLDDDGELWRTCSGVSALLVACHVATGFVRSRDIAPDRVVTPLVLSGVVIALALVVANTRNAIGDPAGVEEWPFRAAVVVQLLSSALFFFIRFFVLESRGEERTNDGE